MALVCVGSLEIDAVNSSHMMSLNFIAVQAPLRLHIDVEHIDLVTDFVLRVSLLNLGKLHLGSLA